MLKILVYCQILASLYFVAAASCLQENTLLCTGISMVTVVAPVDEQFLNKYGLMPGNSMVGSPQHKQLYDEALSKENLTMYPDGSGYNTVKVAQWMLQDPPKVSTYVGWTGEDKLAEVLVEDAGKSNVNVHLYTTADQPTPTILICSCGESPSIVFFSYDRDNFKSAFVDTEAIQKVINEAQCIYSTSFSLFMPGGVTLELAKQASEGDKLYLLSLSASWVVHAQKDALSQVLPHADVLFGSKDEAVALAEVKGFNTTDLKEVAINIQKLPKANNKKERVVVITQGPDGDVLVASKDAVQGYPAWDIEKGKPYNPVNAMDAFVGGFISQLLLEKTYEECVRAANYAVKTAIERGGIYNLPEKPDFV